MFGGGSDVGAEATIGRLDIKTREWFNAGNLEIGRYAHNAIYDGQFVLVIGGIDIRKTEKCLISNDQMTCSSQSPELISYGFYPEVFFVPEGYCKQLY